MQPKLDWLDDPETFRVNQLPAHSDHRWYKTQNEAATKISGFEQSLDGDWQFAFAENPQKRLVGFEQATADHTDFRTITVPSHIELNNDAQIHYINTLYPWEGKQYRRPAYSLGDKSGMPGMFSEAADNSVGAYLKSFTLPENWAGSRVAVQFDGVEEAFYVWLNGQFVGYAEDSFSQSEFDLTPFLTIGENLLAVEVFKRSTASFIEDQDMFRFSGIFRSVRLVSRPQVHVEDLAIAAHVNDDFVTGTFGLQLKLTGDFTTATTVSAIVTDPDGKELVNVINEGKSAVQLDPESVGDIQLWDHHAPKLYQLMLTVRDENGHILEVVPYQFGFRRIEIKDNVILLNGRRLLINGVNRHEWSATGGRCITQAEMDADLQTMVDNHINAVRTCHYPDQHPWYQMCDEAGIYMMAETNLESHGSWQKMGAVEPSYNVPGSLPEWRAAVLDRAKSNYEAFKNHPAVIFWSLGNEAYAGDDIEAMNTYYKTVDPERLTHYEGVIRNRDYEATISDVESRMYASPADIRDYLANAPAKPFMSCEFMHDMGNSLGGFDEYMHLYDEFPSYQGGFIWDFIDQALAVKDEVTGKTVLRYGGDFDDRHSDYEFSGDGLLFANRQPKPAMQEVSYFY
ncbi:glycoside hydrolase family 2 TIM barrel-domain containing protein, partial [Furfurilactobacillus siliginis]